MSRSGRKITVEQAASLTEALKNKGGEKVLNEKAQYVDYEIHLPGVKVIFYRPKQGKLTVYPQGNDYQVFDEAFEAVIGESYLGKDIHPACIELEKQPTKSQLEKDETARQKVIDQVNQKVAEDEANGYTVIFTDGSFNKVSEDEAIPSFGGIIYDSEPHEIKGVITKELCATVMEIEDIDDAQYESVRKQENYAGEVFAVIKVLDFCLENNIKKPSLFVDSTNAMKEFYRCWGDVKDRGSLSVVTKFLNEKLEEYKKELEVKFSWCPSHIGVEKNRAADRLAAEAIEDYKATLR